MWRVATLRPKVRDGDEDVEMRSFHITDFSAGRDTVETTPSLMRDMIFDEERPPEMQAEMDSEGLTRASWAVGLGTLVASTFVYGRWPQHTWLLYLLKLWVYVPVWYVRITRRRRGIWFIVEPCWMGSIAIGLYLLAALFKLLETEEVRLWAFRSFFAMSLGFLSWSVPVTKNVLVWHSMSRTTGVMIHWLPSLVCFTIRWQEQLGVDLGESWPGRFPTVDSMDSTTTLELVIAGIDSYLLWWVFYAFWLLTIGLSLPARGWPTIYNNYREMHMHLFERTGFQTERGQALIFMLIHLFLCLLAFVWSSLCWWFFYVHLVWVVLLFLLVIWEASTYYASKVLLKCSPSPAPPEPPEPEEQTTTVSRPYSMEEDYD